MHESLQIKSQVFILISKIRTFTIFGLQKSHKQQKTQKLWKQHSLHLLLRSKSFFAALLSASAVLPHGSAVFVVYLVVFVVLPPDFCSCGPKIVEVPFLEIKMNFWSKTIKFQVKEGEQNEHESFIPTCFRAFRDGDDKSLEVRYTFYILTYEENF